MNLIVGTMPSTMPHHTTKGSLIGEGRTAQVYTWGAGHVLKLYYDWWPQTNIEYEARIGSAVHAAGVPSPDVGEIVQVDGRLGLIYERIDGPDMSELLLSEPQRLEELAITFAQLHAAMHCPAPGSGLPLQRQKLLHHLELASPTPLSNASKDKVIGILKDLPDGNLVCHGDLHPANVLLSRRGPVAIDWENAGLGNPLADVARSALLLETAHLQMPDMPFEVVEGIAAFRQVYLQSYSSLTGADLDQLKPWRSVVAAARLHEGIEVEEAYLLNALAP